MARGSTGREGRAARSELGASASAPPPAIVKEVGRISNKVVEYFADLTPKEQDELRGKLKSYSSKMDSFVGEVNALIANAIPVDKNGVIDGNKAAEAIYDLETLGGMSLINKYAGMVARDILKNVPSTESYFAYIRDTGTALAHTMATEGVKINKDTYKKGLKDAYNFAISRGFSQKGAEATMRFVNMQAVTIMSDYLPKKENKA